MRMRAHGTLRLTLLPCCASCRPRFYLASGLAVAASICQCELLAGLARTLQIDADCRSWTGRPSLQCNCAVGMADRSSVKKLLCSACASVTDCHRRPCHSLATDLCFDSIRADKSLFSFSGEVRLDPAGGADPSPKGRMTNASERLHHVSTFNIFELQRRICDKGGSLSVASSRYKDGWTSGVCAIVTTYVTCVADTCLRQNRLSRLLS